MSVHHLSLSQLGWRAHFSQQLTLEILERCFPARVASVNRALITTLSEHGEIDVRPPPDVRIAVGDWVLLESTSHRLETVLDRCSVISRIAAGNAQSIQLIAANLDTLFIITSCNHDLNLSRLERYLAMALEAKVEPVVVLTKADLCGDVDYLREPIERSMPQLAVIALNALDANSASQLAPWLQPSATVAFVGSSGVGKSTLVNTLTGAMLPTEGVREHDSKGRHTTTSRQLIKMPGGAWLIDTPGMRELKVGVVEHGIQATFNDVELIALHCTYRDCKHQGDAGCAVQAAVDAGTLEQRRLVNYLKLQREAKHAARSIRERRAAERRFGKDAKRIFAERQKARDRT